MTWKIFPELVNYNKQTFPQKAKKNVRSLQNQAVILRTALLKKVSFGLRYFCFCVKCRDVA